MSVEPENTTTPRNNPTMAGNEYADVALPHDANWSSTASDCFTASDFDHEKSQLLLQQFQDTLKREFTETKSSIRRALKEVVGYQKETASLKAQWKPIAEKQQQEEDRIKEIESEAAERFNQYMGT